jgi:hypothetical protein
MRKQVWALAQQQVAKAIGFISNFIRQLKQTAKNKASDNSYEIKINNLI